MVRLLEANLKGQLKLQEGSKVQVHGLQNQKELNGLIGSLLQFDAVKLRWGVKLDNGKRVSLKMGNFIPLETEVLPCAPRDVAATESSTKSGGPPDAVIKDSIDISTGAHANEAKDEGTEDCAVADPPCEQLCEGITNAVVGIRLDEDIKYSAKAAPAWMETQGHAPPSGTTEVAGRSEAIASQAETVASAPSSESNQVGTDVLAVNDEDWPVLPTSAETAKKMRSGCWFDGGSAAKRFTEQLHANDPGLVSVCLVPPKRFNDDDALQICDALDRNSVCHELIASGHVLSDESCERIRLMLRSSKTLQTFSVGDSTLGEQASILFKGLAENVSLTALDFEHKGLTVEACKSLATALADRQHLDAARLSLLKLSRNSSLPMAMPELASSPAPIKLVLSECSLTAKHAEHVGRWVAKGVEDLDLRDNSSWGGEGLEKCMNTLLASENFRPALRCLRLDGCAIGDDGLEILADAFEHGLELEELFIERCEITKVGCTHLEHSLHGRRLRMLSARANVIGDEGCTLLARCAERLDLSSTNLSGQVLVELGEQPLVSLELFSNPALGPSVNNWCSSLDCDQWQRLEHLDLCGCALNDEGFNTVMSTLMAKSHLMPSLACLCLGANSLTEDDAKCELVERLGEARQGKLKVIWQST